MTPLVGIMVTALLAFFFGEWKRVQEQRTKNRTEAYTQLLQAIAGLAHAQKQADEPAIAKAQGAFEDARLRLAIYGGVNVARAFAQFLAAGGRLQTRAQLQAFIATVKAMRTDGYQKRSELTDEEFLRILFNKGDMPDS